MKLRILNDFLQLFFPRLCVSCERKLVDGEELICLDCIQNLVRTRYAWERDNPLEELFSGRIPFKKIASFAYFAKEGILQQIIHALKYRGKPQLGEILGKLAYRDTKSSDFFTSIDVLIPVPLHPKRIRKRGYNQSFHFAKGLSNFSGIALSSDNLVRIVNNPSQTTMSRTQRWKNVDGIFSVMHPEAFCEKHILLVDDILTTGSTLEACAKVLLEKCNGVKISIFVIGSTK